MITVSIAQNGRATPGINATFIDNAAEHPLHLIRFAQG